MSDKAWANESLRMALQNIQDVATKPLHVEIERLREVERLLTDANTALGEANDALNLELAEARKALRVYGGHIPICYGRPCTCGFQKVFDAATQDSDNNR